MPTKTELTLEQSQQGVSNDVLKPGQYIIYPNYKMIAGIEERRHGPSDAMHNPSQPFEFLSKETYVHGMRTSKPGESDSYVLEDPTLLSWKTCQGDSLNST
ncbi:hypothetical protein Tco_0761481 [Tanacetum coccineum]